MQTLDNFRQIKKVRISDTVVQQIITLIEQGILKPGDYLPGERELVSKFNVARASIREALRILEYQGVIAVQSGKGAIVVDDMKGADEEVVRSWFKEHAGEKLEILEVRDALESRAARLAATNSTPELIKELQATLPEADVLINQGDMLHLVYLDRKYHNLIADASNNYLLIKLIDMTIDIFPHPRHSLYYLNDRANLSWRQHLAILNAIIDHDPELAYRAMEEHFLSIRKTIEGIIDSL